MSGVHAHANSGVGMPPGYPEQHAKHVRGRSGEAIETFSAPVGGPLA
jgi:hypothetical protein